MKEILIEISILLVILEDNSRYVFSFLEHALFVEYLLHLSLR